MHLNGNFSSETQLNEKLDYIYSQSKLGRVFHGILEVAANKTTIITAIHKIKSNKGAMTAGIDGQKMNRYLQMDMDKLISLIQQNIYSYRPRPVRRVYIEKANGKKRPLGIPTILDRIIQQCLKIVLEPIAEAKFYPESYGFRPYRSTKHAVQEMFQLANCNLKQKPYYCIEGDIKGYFDNINHRLLLRKLWNIGIHDKRIIAIINEMLRAGYFEYEHFYTTEKGTPQGGILSPLLANIYLNDFDWYIGRTYHYPFQKTTLLAADRINLRRRGIIPKYLIRYADDWIIMTTTMQEAKRLLQNLTKYFKHRLKVELSSEKTVITNLGETHIDFLGYRMLTERKRNGHMLTDIISCKTYPNPLKVNKQIRSLRDEISQLYLIRKPLGMAIHIEKINAMIIGIAEYWKTALCSKTFHKIDHAVNRKAYEIFHKIYGSKALGFNVPMAKLHNRPDRHKGYKDTAFAVKLNDMWIGLTKTYLTHTSYLKNFFDQKLTPYTEAGRDLYKSSQRRQMPLARPTLYDDADILHKAMDSKLYNFEYFMNREYAYNRDRARCKCCDIPLLAGNRNCHHVKPNLPPDKLNKVPNLAWLCINCHKLIHAKEPLSGLSSKAVKKITQYKKITNRSFLKAGYGRKS